MPQGDQALAVRMQKAEIARPPKSLGQDVLHHQPQKRRAGYGADFHPPGLGIAIAEPDSAAIDGDDILLGDHAAVQSKPHPKAALTIRT